MSRVAGRWPLVLVGWLALGWSAAAPALERTNRLVNPGFEAGATGWAAYGSGFAVDTTVHHHGRASLRCDGATSDAVAGARQVLTFDPPLRHPFRVAGWSRARDAEVTQDYDLYLDLHYADGTPLWGQLARFSPGTHDWQRSELVFDVAKPVRSIEVFVLFRKARGTVWFDDLEVGPAPFELTSLQVLPGVFGGGSLLARASASLPAHWTAVLRGPTGEVARAAGERGPLQLDFAGRSGVVGPHQLELRAVDDLAGEERVVRRTVTLPPGGAGHGFACWPAGSMVRVLRRSVPAPGEPPRLALAGGEAGSFQLALLAAPGEAQRGLTVECEAPRNGARRLGLEWQQVGWVRVDKLRRHPGQPDAEPGWWPDPLLPVDRFDLEPGRAQSLWFTVHVPPGAAAGEYRGSLSIGTALRRVVVPLRVEVYPFTLPTRGHLRTAFALMDGFLERVYGAPLSPALRQRYGDFLLAHRLNPDDISRTDPPALDDLRHYEPRGLNAFNVLNLVKERGRAAWRCFGELADYTPAFKAQVTARLDAYMARLRPTGLARLGYVYGFDERGRDFYPVIREYFGLIKQRYPELRTLTTAAVPLDPALLTELHIDDICPLTPAYDRAKADACRAAGHGVWAYVCLGPGYPYANILADCPLLEARVLGWQAWQQRLDGLLYWGLNIWDRPGNGRPLDLARGPLLDWSITTGGDYDWLHGDGRLLYAGADGPVGSLRLAVLRDGLQDYEYLWLLAQRNPAAAARLCGEVTRGWTEFERDPARLAGVRARVAALLAQP